MWLPLRFFFPDSNTYCFTMTFWKRFETLWKHATSAFCAIWLSSLLFIFLILLRKTHLDKWNSLTNITLTNITLKSFFVYLASFINWFSILFLLIWLILVRHVWGRSHSRKWFFKKSFKKFYTKYSFKYGKSISTKVITIIVVVLQIHIWKRSVALKVTLKMPTNVRSIKV